MRARFVGREQEMAALTGLLSRLDARSGPVVALVLGAPGSGKTRLLTELRSRLDLAEQVWLRGFELEAGIPLATSRPLLQRLRDVPQLGGTISALAFGPGDDAGVVNEVRIFEAVHRARSAVGPMLVVVDDLHWADELSTSLLHYTVRAAHDARQPLAVVAASRPARRARALRESFAELLEAGFTELTLEPLTEEAGTRMAQDLAPHLGAEAAAGVWRRSGGSPFWLTLLASGQDVEHDVDRVVAERLDQTGPDGAAVVRLLAVIGHPVAVEEVACALGWPGDRVDRAVSMLEQVGLVARSRPGLDVTHDLIRAAAGRTAGDAQARRLHREWGRCVEHEAGDDETALLEALDHLRAGGADVTPLARRLAGSRRRRLLGRPGLELLLAVAEEAPNDEEDRLAAELGGMASELGAHDVALRIWSQRPTLGRPDDEVARAALQAAAAATALSLGAEARQHLDRARAHAGDDPVLTTEVLAQEAVIQRYGDGDPETSRATAARALATIRPHLVPAGEGDRVVQAATRRAWLQAALAATEGALTSDDPQQMLTLADELAAAAAGVDDRVEVQALTEGAMALRFLGRNTDAEVRLRHAWDLCHRRLLPESTLQVGTTLAHVLLSLGRLAEAAELIRECRAVGRRVSAVTPMRAFGVTLAWSLEASTGSWRTAVDGLRAAAREEHNPHFRLQAHLERATTVSRLDPDGGGEEVRECVAAALDDAATAGCRRCLSETVLRCAQGLARVGSLAEARELAARTSVNAADQYLQFWAAWTGATIQLAAGDLAAAGTLQDVVDLGQRQGLRLESLWARLDLAAALLGADRDRALEVLTGVCADAERMGAATELQVAGRLLRGQGVRAWRRGGRATGPDQLGALTPREREVARLVATGASNPEIAAAVFLSRRTVEHHVSNVLAKLGLRNRAELTALVAGEHAAPRGTG